ncbi:MAG: hypothetical protein C4575_07085 [Desulforudis sp.]|nr:MAG: hypothetical protein C4575_07085 [Desulforudis sp.]
MEFMMVFLIIAFLAFAGTDAALTMTQHQTAKHLLKQTADRVRYEGRLSTADETAIRDKFAQVGLAVETFDTRRESAGQSRILRTNDPSASMIPIRIVCKTDYRPFRVGGLIGGKAAGDSWRIAVETVVISERVNP